MVDGRGLAALERGTRWSAVDPFDYDDFNNDYMGQCVQACAMLRVPFDMSAEPHSTPAK